MNDRIVRTTGHVSLSFSPADLPKLDDESMVKYAEEYMESGDAQLNRMLIEMPERSYR